jgi:hypothetical protein
MDWAADLSQPSAGGKPPIFNPDFVIFVAFVFRAEGAPFVVASYRRAVVASAKRNRQT